MDDDHDPYSLIVQVKAVDKPTVALGLSWPDQKTPEELADVASQLTFHVTAIAEQVGM